MMINAIRCCDGSNSQSFGKKFTTAGELKGILRREERGNDFFIKRKSAADPEPKPEPVPQPEPEPRPDGPEDEAEEIGNLPIM